MSAEPNASPTAGLDENVAGLLCYLFGWVSGLVFLLIDKRPFVRFHAAQSIGLCVGAFAVMIVFWIITLILTVITAMIGLPIGFLTVFLFPLLMLAFLALFIICMIKAYQNQKYKLPIIGDMVEKMVGA